MAKLVLTRHGITDYNREKRFCGFTDVDLPEDGRQQAQLVGQKLKDAGFQFQAAYTSWLKRSWITLDLILKELQQEDLSITKHPFLNERHYGDLQGHLHEEMRQKVGAEQVHIWRRSYATRPPNGESLKDVVHRTQYYLNDEIIPRVQAGEDILICAHGNSNRAMVKQLENVSDEDIVGRNIAWEEALVYDVDEQGQVTKLETL